VPSFEECAGTCWCQRRVRRPRPASSAQEGDQGQRCRCESAGRKSHGGEQASARRRTLAPPRVQSRRPLLCRLRPRRRRAHPRRASRRQRRLRRDRGRVDHGARGRVRQREPPGRLWRQGRLAQPDGGPWHERRLRVGDLGHRLWGDPRRRRRGLLRREQPRRRGLDAHGRGQRDDRSWRRRLGRRRRRARGRRGLPAHGLRGELGQPDLADGRGARRNRQTQPLHGPRRDG
jgi:hypothetical protein